MNSRKQNSKDNPGALPRIVFIKQKKRTMAVLNAEIERRALLAARILNQVARVQAVYVFGSQVEGHADEWSDIDVAVFLDGAESWDMQKRAQTMFQVQKGAGLDVEAHLFPSSTLVHPEPASFAAYVIKHGVRLPLEYDGV